ncbi:MAG: hypothetical protein WAK84_11160 [Candidatus Cybelea sp.]
MPPPRITPFNGKYSELQRVVNSLCDFGGGRTVDLSQVGAVSSAAGLRIDVSAYLAIARAAPGAPRGGCDPPQPDNIAAAMTVAR